MALKLFLCTFISTLSFRIAFQSFYFWFFIFIFFLPILWLENEVYTKKLKKRYFFIWIWLIFLFINVSVLYWTVNDTLISSIILYVCNGLLMSLPILLFCVLHRRLEKLLTEKYVYVGFGLFWLSFEYLHSLSDFAFPFLNLGNIFSSIPQIIQWFSITGILGGSFWVLLVNVFIFITYQKSTHQNIFTLIFLVVMPIFISFLMLYTTEKDKETKEILIMHPNMVRYGQDALLHIEQINKYTEIINKNITKNTDYVLMPETAIQIKQWRHLLDNHLPTLFFQQITKKYPKLKIIAGVITSEYSKDSIETEKEKYTNKHFKTYNAMIQIDNTKNVQWRTKSKLVPYEERRPYYLDWFSPIYFYFGGERWNYTKNLGIENNFFEDNISGLNVVPLICYESFFDEFATTKMNQKTMFLTCSANEVWYKNTEGITQEFEKIRLLAICTSKSVARSSDFGGSGLVDKQGNVLVKLDNDKKDFLLVNIPINTKNTLFMYWGEIIGKIALFFMLFIILVILSCNYT
ncbi:MAG: apolipoprotein N-acyltransferase [Cytophagia bacterium]|nr:MAG: apolipoprotein N-acyltransferase [Cytophagia bacterium]TAG43493.1 MAG: apolipoprotein N-acyltransferase [Cytophagia bacterium]